MPFFTLFADIYYLAFLVPDHMTLDAFCRNLRGCNDRKDFDRSQLAQLYESINSNEIRWEGDGSGKWSFTVVQIVGGVGSGLEFIHMFVCAPLDC